MKKLLYALVVFIAVFIIGAFFVKSNGVRARDEFRVAFVDAASKFRRAVFEEYVPRLGTAAILDVLEEKYPLCHDEAHELGKLVFSETQDFETSINICRDRCSGGCFHGVLMEAFKKYEPTEEGEEHVSIAELREKALTICDSTDVAALHRKGKCIHGMGHVFAYLSKYNLGKAMELCKIYEDKALQYYCAGGVFMEYEIVRGRETTSETLHYPCDTYAEFPAACYPHHMPHMERILGSVSRVEEECVKLVGFARIGCFRALGTLQNNYVTEDHSRIAGLCPRGTMDDRKACIEGAIVKLAEVSDENGYATCEYLDGELQEYCREMVRLGAYSLERSFELYFE